MPRGKGQKRAWGRALAAALALLLFLSLCLMAGHSLRHLGHRHGDLYPAAGCALCAQLSLWRKAIAGLLLLLCPALSLYGLRRRPRLSGRSRRPVPDSPIALQVKLTI